MTESNPETVSRQEAVSRRSMLRRSSFGLAAAAGLANLAPGARAQSLGVQTPASIAAQAALAQDARFPQIPSWSAELHQLAPNVFAYTNASGPGVDNATLSNAGVVVGDDLLAIDTLGPPIHAKAFLAAARKATGKNFGRVLNTHHHRDHTNGNCFFTQAEIVSHEYTRKAVIEQGIPAHPYDNRPTWQEGMNELKLAPPTTTFTDHLTWRYGGMEVQAIYNGPGHTWGDVMVYIPQHRILFAADIAFFYVTPAGQSGHITKWIEAVDRAMKFDADIVVPGHGPIGTKRDLGQTREYLDLLVTEVQKRYRLGMRPGEAVADLDMGRFNNWTNPERNVWNAVRLYAEWNGTLTPDTDTPATDRALADYNAIKARKK